MASSFPYVALKKCAYIRQSCELLPHQHLSWEHQFSHVFLVAGLLDSPQFRMPWVDLLQIINKTSTHV